MRRWVQALAVIAALVVIASAAAALCRWPLGDAVIRRQVIAHIEQSSGLSATASGPMTVRLLPRPVVELRGVKLRGLSDAVMLDADAVRSRLDLEALLAGKLQVAGASFDSPTIVLDVDRLQPFIEGLLGPGGVPPSLSIFHTGGLTLHSGVVRLLSRDHRRDTLLTDLTATLEWPSDAAGASLAGSGNWRGISGEFGIDIAAPAEALRGGQTLASARLKSTAVDASVEGTLSAAADRRVVGKLLAATRDLPGFLRTIGMATPQLDALHQARLSGSATLSGDTLSLDPATLDLDNMTFEGALTMHERDGHTGLAGTLATDRIDLDPFLQALPVMLASGGGWDDTALQTRGVAYDDIDLRISASTARVRTFLMEDGSLSLQSGDGRMELSIGEARAYDGLLKGRVVATLDADQTDIRADATLSRLDLRSLFKDVPGAYQATGTLSSHFAVEARGRTPAELAGDLTGRGQMSVRDGEIGASLLAAFVQAAPQAPQSAVPMLAGGAAPFESAAFDVAVARGKASLHDSWIAWPGFHVTIDGSADLPRQTLDIRAVVSPDSSEESADATTVFGVKGDWRDLLLRPARPHS